MPNPNKTLEKATRLYIFPLILFLFPLINLNKGIDLTDTGFNLANYTFFHTITNNQLFLSTYLSNITGYLLTLLPFGQTMLGMKFYTTLLVSLMALIGYRFFITKMPAPIAFISQMAAVGLCWCPTVIIYNYLTYFLFLLGAILLFRGLAGSHPYCLVLAGICLGLNVFVRNPNVMQAALILCVWYYALLRRRKFVVAARDTLLCLAGYMGALIVMGIIMILHYGVRAPYDMISGLFQMSESNSHYTIGGMLWSIISAYLTGGKWLVYMIICILPGIPFLMIRTSGLFRHKISEEKITLIKKIAYCTAIGFLFYALSRIGMYNFRYYQKDSALQWAVIFIIISLANMIWMLFSKAVDIHWKLIASIGIIIILVTPLGSNNHLWPLINNLFFIAPVTIWRLYHFARYGKQYIISETNNEQAKMPLFPIKAMQMAIITALIIQSIGVGSFHVFRDGENGEKRGSTISGNNILKGMKTTEENAVLLQELNDFLSHNPGLTEAELILYGDIPALSYYLNRPTALSSTWPDLDTFPAKQFIREIDEISSKIGNNETARPLIIINTALPLRETGPQKEASLFSFIAGHNYNEVFRNERYIIFA